MPQPDLNYLLLEEFEPHCLINPEIELTEGKNDPIHLDPDKTSSKLQLEKWFLYIDEIRPHITAIMNVSLSNPHFPNEIDKFNSLGISVAQTASGNVRGHRQRYSTDLLRPLSIHHTPLEPFSRITTLTKFTFTDLDFACPLDTLLVFLKGNPSLEKLSLNIRFLNPAHRRSQDKALVHLKRLRSLSVKGEDIKDLFALISYIPVSKSAELEFSLPPRGMKLNRVLSHLRIKHAGAFYMRMNYYRMSIRLVGPNGRFCISSLSDEEMSSLLSGKSLLGLKNIRELHFRGTDVSTLPSLKLSWFPALKTFTIEHGECTATPLFKLLSLSRVDKLIIVDCFLSRDFLNKSYLFASARGMKVCYEQNPDLALGERCTMGVIKEQIIS